MSIVKSHESEGGVQFIEIEEEKTTPLKGQTFGWMIVHAEDPEKEAIDMLSGDIEIHLLYEHNRKLAEEKNKLIEENKNLGEMVQRLIRELAKIKRKFNLYEDETKNIRNDVTRGRELYLEDLKKSCGEKGIPLIQYYRILRGLTQGELALKIGEQQPHISRWEAGNTQPNSTNLARLADALNVTVDQLLGRED